MSSTSYLGKKGYTIHKSELTVSQQENIRKLLRVRAYVPNSPVKGDEFEVYRESKSKMYVPRYFGMQHFGKPTKNKLPLCEKINLPFAGELRDYQNHIVGEFMKKASDGGGLLEIPCGRGKTVMALKILSEIGVKTLVVVHKSFLLNQWVERIEQFLPGARVGRIQGQIIDVEDKDVVIGMLQSLSMKDYPNSMFESFGLTIVDEVHHIAAEVFVRSLFKIVSHHMLGLSATMQRKDGLTKVFKMFLGDVVYKEKANMEHNVLVKAIEFQSADEEFNTIVYDYRGNPQYSTMISKLCSFYDRSNFILKVLKTSFQEDPKQQIIILAHNKNLLTYLYKAIDEDDYATVGYYVGGMKEAALKESESKNIIIATYSMASEALDIKSLTTLLMATPKTDITQSVGRILRTKHSQPVVIDIIDKHPLFQRQWQKRKTYYHKQKYSIIKTTNVGYNSNNWEKIEKKKKGKNNPDENAMIGKCLI
jgi:superfamily II DNA or RNA helicase|tara:strand:- start:130 stop:1563 length:1434 start_codon:yes stop_codon:yes gene_type:complete